VREPATVAALAAATAHRNHDRVAVAWRPTGDDASTWSSRTWAELARRWRHGALALEADGLQPGDRVRVPADVAHEWTEIEHGVLAAGGVSVAGDAPSDVAHVVTAARWHDLVARGAEIDDEQPDRFEKLVERIDPDAPATVDGDRELSHGQVLWWARSLDRFVTPVVEDEREEHTVACIGVGSFLGRLFAQYWPARTGATVWWPAHGATSDAVTDVVREAQPTVLAGPASLWRDLAAVAAARANDTWLALGRTHVAGEPMGATARASRRALQRMFGRRLARDLGIDRCHTRLAVDDLDRATSRELAAVGIDVARAFAPSACGVVAVDGRVAPGVAARVRAGEVDVRGPGTIEWTATGLAGAIDERGRLLAG